MAYVSAMRLSVVQALLPFWGFSEVWIMLPQVCSIAQVQESSTAVSSLGSIQDLPLACIRLCGAEHSVLCLSCGPQSHKGVQEQASA